MGLTADLIKEIAKKGVLQKYGEAKGEAINFLLFGAYGVPGLIDDATLVAKALEHNNKNLGEEFTQDMATNFVMDSAALVVQTALKKLGIGIFDVLENPILFLNILFSPEKIGDQDLPIEVKQQYLPQTKVIEKDVVIANDTETGMGKSSGHTSNKLPEGVNIINVGVGGGGSYPVGSGTGSGSYSGGSGGGSGGISSGGAKSGGGGGGGPIIFDEPLVITGSSGGGSGGSGGSGSKDKKIPEDPK